MARNAHAEGQRQHQNKTAVIEKSRARSRHAPAPIGLSQSAKTERQSRTAKPMRDEAEIPRTEAIIPVSYTHLDVYKRQAEELATCGAAGLLATAIASGMMANINRPNTTDVVCQP